jgi:hypothetical protein
MRPLFIDKRRESMKKHQAPRRNKGRQSNPKRFDMINPDAAGIDIGSREHYVAVPPGRDSHKQDVRHFQTFTADLYALAEWLEQCNIKTVAMESTSVYWIPLFEILDAKDFTVCLVNPRSVKNAPARKTDVLDCQWLQQLHSYGLLQSAFRPDEQVCTLRSYMRQRGMLIKSVTKSVQHMQKALDQMNLKLHQVVNDITGTTGMRIIGSILDGERDPVALARLRDPRCKNDQQTIAKALQGNWRSEHLFALKQAVDLFHFHRSQIADCDCAIEQHLYVFEERNHDNPGSNGKHKSRKNSFSFNAYDHLKRITGIDLTRIDGVDAQVGLGIVSEIGLDMTSWPTEKHFGSWLGLSPGSKITGGKQLNPRTKPSANRAAEFFRLCANSLHRSNTALGAFLRRKKAQLGAPKAITATAYKIARIFYNMLKHGSEYADPGPNYYEKRYRKRMVNNLKRKAKQFGYELVQTSENIDNMETVPG